MSDKSLDSIPRLYPLSFWLKICSLCAAGCVTGYLLLRWFYMRELSSEYSQAFYTLKNMMVYLAPTLMLCALLVLFVALVTVSTFAVIASHKVAGPLFRLQRVGDYLGKKILIGRITLRKNDWLKPVSDHINLWVEERKGHYEGAREKAARMEDLLDGAKLAAGSGDYERARARIGDLIALCDAD